MNLLFKVVSVVLILTILVSYSLACWQALEFRFQYALGFLACGVFNSLIYSYCIREWEYYRESEYQG